MDATVPAISTAPGRRPGPLGVGLIILLRPGWDTWGDRALLRQWGAAFALGAVAG